MPIGVNAQYSFKGTFNGNGKTITGLYINDPGRLYAGLFGYVFTGGKVENVIIKDADITARGNPGSATGGVGGVVGYLNNGSVINCHVSGTVKGHDRVGGIAGMVNVSGIGLESCSFSGVVRGTGSGTAFDNIGGIVGYIANSRVTSAMRQVRWKAGTT